MPEVVLTKKNFQEEVAQSKDLVLIDFWAEWCGPCKMIAPILEEVSKEYEGKGLKVGKVNIEESGELASQFQVMNIPTLLFFKDGQVVEQSVGFMPKEELMNKIDSLLG